MTKGAAWAGAAEGDAGVGRERFRRRLRLPGVRGRASEGRERVVESGEKDREDPKPSAEAAGCAVFRSRSRIAEREKGER